MRLATIYRVLATTGFVFSIGYHLAGVENYAGHSMQITITAFCMLLLAEITDLKTQ